MRKRADRALEELRSYGRALIAAAELVPAGIPATVPGRSALVLRPAIRLALALAVVWGGIAVGTAADAAAPGELLYPVDRGIEIVAGWVGLGGDATSERISEANYLLATGRPADAIRTAAAAIPATTEEVTQAVLDAVSSLPAAATVRRLDLHIAVGDLITAAHGAAQSGRPGDDVLVAAYRVVDVAQGAHATPAPATDGLPPSGAAPDGNAGTANA